MVSSANLPQNAQLLVAQIEALLDQAEAMLADPASPADAAYGIRATRSDYLPQTLARYIAVPQALRGRADEDGKSPDTLLLEQLSVLVRAVSGHVDVLAAHHRIAQAAQGRFLAERFNDRDTAIETVDQTQIAPATAKRFLANMVGEAASDPLKIVASVATHLGQLLPQFTQIEKGGIFGLGAIEVLHVTVPSADGNAFRFSLSARNNAVAASCTRIIKSVPIKTVAATVDEWFESLYEEIVGYAQHHADVKRSLERFS